jgi:endonuclease YncB( thermonuclease family)
LFFSTYTHAGTLSWLGDERWVTVAKVYDGDTFQTRHGEKVRLLNLNTPEIQHRDNLAQPGGNKASKALNALILGQQVKLTFDKEKKDKYGRTLAHIWMRDGLWVNQYMIQKGYAHVYTFEPNTRWVQKLLKAEHQAREKKLGIWGLNRFKVLDAQHLSTSVIGQFRVVEGKVSRINDKKGWSFRMGKLNISIPRRVRGIFHQPPHLHIGESVSVRGKVRVSRKGQLFLALYSPYDLEHL